MDRLSLLVTHTPWYAFAALAYGLFAGIRALRPRSMLVQTTPILPAVFFVLSITTMISTAASQTMAAAAWIVALGAGVALGASLLSANVLAVDHARKSVRVGRDATVLVVFVAFFGARYFDGIVHVVRPLLAANPRFVMAMAAGSGISTGIMLGRVLKLLVAYGRARPAVAA